MGIVRAIAVVGAIATGALGLSQSGALASPLASAAMPAAKFESGLVGTAQYWGRPRYVQHRPYGYGYGYGRPHYRRYGRPYPVVCRTEFRVVRTPYGRIVRRPVQVCTRRY
jgi:hypothetical protein